MEHLCSYWTERRTDVRTAVLIDAAINAASSRDVFSTAKELLVQRTPPDVVIRILLRPTKRRLYREN